jgi:hypothetical protein
MNSTHLRIISPRRAITRPLLILSIVWVVASLIFVLITSLEADHEASLLQNGATIRASITDYRISTRSGRYASGDSYDVQYQFSLDDGTGPYTASDATGRRNLWCSLAKPDYDAAIASGKIDILYLPQNPWVNRPLRSESTDLGTLVIIDLLWLVSTLVAFGVIRKYVRQRTGAPPHPGQ